MNKMLWIIIISFLCNCEGWPSSRPHLVRVLYTCVDGCSVTWVEFLSFSLNVDWPPITPKWIGAYASIVERPFSPLERTKAQGGRAKEKKCTESSNFFVKTKQIRRFKMYKMYFFPQECIFSCQNRFQALKPENISLRWDVGLMLLPFNHA